MEITRNGLNGLKFLDVAGNGRKVCIWLEMVKIGWKTAGMAKNCIKWLNIAGMAGN